MSGTRDLAGLAASGRGTTPDRTVATPPPRRRAAGQEESAADPAAASTAPAHKAAGPGTQPSVPGGRRSLSRHDKTPVARQRAVSTTVATTVRISVNIPLGCKQWVADQAREQQRFVSEIVMEALERHGEDASPPSGRAKRVVVPDGTIYNIVLPADDRQRLDDLAARKKTTRSALLTEILRRASTDRSGAPIDEASDIDRQ